MDRYYLSGRYRDCLKEFERMAEMGIYSEKLWGWKQWGLTPLRECYRCYEKNAGPEGPNSIWISPKDISSLLRELRESRDSLETDVAIVGITVGIVSKE